IPDFVHPAALDLASAEARLDAANVDRPVRELRGRHRSGESHRARLAFAHQQVEPVQLETNWNNAAGVDDDRAGRNLRLRAQRRRSISFLEVREMRRAYEAGALERRRSLPTTADQRSPRPQLRT